LEGLWEEKGGEVVLHEWVEYLKEVGGGYICTDEELTSTTTTTIAGDPNISLELESSSSSSSSKKKNELVDFPEIEIFSGDIFTDRKSRFQAHLARVYTPQQVQYVLRTIKSDLKIANATHNMVAFRLSEKNHEDRDDDGEGGAGDRMLYLMQRMGVLDAVGVVTRWYGGIPLGPDRFKGKQLKPFMFVFSRSFFVWFPEVVDRCFGSRLCNIV
jgi:hypothetical protein